ncbi:MAG: thioredoxin family protein [Flavobacteriales bacterium]
MKKIFLILSASLFFIACGTEANSEKCEKDCKKESCEHGDKKCADDCKKECCSKDEKKESDIMELGTQNPSLEVKLKDISGEEMYLEQLRTETGSLIIFSCNTCPFVVGRGEETEGWQNRYNDIQALAAEFNIGFALVNSNEGKRENEDSFEKMVNHAKENEYNNIKYLMDENHVVADAFMAKTTPHVYLFDGENKLVYTGAIDDNVDKKAEVKEHWLADAMKSLAKGEEIATPVTKNMGCSIKRLKK